MSETVTTRKSGVASYYAQYGHILTPLLLALVVVALDAFAKTLNLGFIDYALIASTIFDAFGSIGSHIAALFISAPVDVQPTGELIKVAN